MKKLWIAIILAAFALDARAQELRVGSATVRITPEVGAPMGSSYGLAISEGVHDDLFAKALVLERNGVKAALVACDLISIRKAIVAEARRLIEARTGLRGRDVILSATHCHAGPQMHPMFLRLLAGEPERMGLEYVRRLPAWIAESVRNAEQALQPAHLSVGTIREDSLSFNRRFLMEDGSVRMNPGRRNPSAVRAVGPVDPVVSVADFQSVESGESLATLVNFALHVASVGGREISADFPGVLSRHLEKARGRTALTLFTNGMSGNVNHVDTSRTDQLTGHQEAERIGAVLAARVLEALPNLRRVKPGPLQARSRLVNLPVRAVSEEEVDEARNVFARFGTPEPPPFHDVVRAWRVIELSEMSGGVLETEIQALTLGDEVAFVGFPGDAFVELGLSIKTGSPFPFTVVSEQAGNGAISYVPNLKAFWEGGYEVISARFLPGGGERLVEAVQQLLIALYPHKPVAPVQ
jgi:neutral ceramidase